VIRLIELARKVRGIFGPLHSGFPDEWQLLPALHVNEAGWLEGDLVQHAPMHSSWHYPRLSTPTGDPLAIVAHVSATNPGTARGMAKRRTVPRQPEDRPASWHISIEADGSILQMASLEAGTWHAAGQIKGAGSANRVSVGIELIGWERGPWPELQIQGACRVWRAIVQSYGIKRELAMVPHAVIDPARRSDPGQLWMRSHAPFVLGFAFA
jgi:hypothetical protein